MTLTQYISDIKNRRVAVLGAGVSNMPLIKRLLSDGVSVTVRDLSSREKLGERGEELLKLGARLITGVGYLEKLDEDIIFRTPGIRPDKPEISAAVARGAVLTSEMELFFDVCPCRMIAVTGSDGKTTTTTVISELLKGAGYTVHVGGNIGAPLLCGADEMSPEDFAVLELSSFQLMTMKRSPDIAVVTNLAPNHLDWHLGMDEYIAAKKNIFLHQSEKGVLVLNADNELSAPLEKEARGEVRFFSRRIRPENGAFLDAGTVFGSIGGKYSPIVEENHIKIPGQHNIENYMAAFCAVRGLVSTDVMNATAKTFGGVAHRIELVRELRGVKFYNDSIASSPSRTRAGLLSFDEPVILIAGGKDKGVPFDELGELINDRVKKLVLTGLTAEKIKAAVVNAKNYNGTLPVFVVEDFADAVKKAASEATIGDTVILSPACTSFDRFRNFEERGNYFKEIVNGLE